MIVFHVKINLISQLSLNKLFHRYNKKLAIVGTARTALITFYFLLVKINSHSIVTSQE